MSWCQTLPALLLLTMLILIGNSSVAVQNSTITLASPQLAALRVNGVDVTYVSLPAGSSKITTYYQARGLVLITISNASLKLINVSPTYVQSLGGWTADVTLCVNSSNASLAGIWQGSSYVNASGIPGLESIINGSEASCGHIVEFEGNLPEFQLVTYFTNSTWLSVLLRGDGWYANIVLGGLTNGPSAHHTQPQGLPPPIYVSPGSGGGEALGKDLLEGPYVLLIISLLALTTSLVVERGRR
ncbi:hypothetical protein [Acidilobus saccharovorans]|nr:hypothetical protein [Acidilobus saccharovorans]